MNDWTLAASFTVLLIIGLGLRVVKRKKSLAVLHEREALDDEQIFQRFYAATNLDKKSVMMLWHEIAQVLHVPAAQLRPSDQFGKEIGAYWITSEHLDALGEVAQARAKRLGVAIDLASINTVDDYVKKLST